MRFPSETFLDFQSANNWDKVSIGSGIASATAAVSILPGETPLEEIDMSCHSFNLCKRAGFHSAEDLEHFLFRHGAMELAFLFDCVYVESGHAVKHVSIRQMWAVAEALEYFEHWNGRKNA